MVKTIEKFKATRCSRHPYKKGKAPIPPKQVQSVVQKILMLILTATRHGFTHCKAASVRRRNRDVISGRGAL
jgi:hypothetical protein